MQAHVPAEATAVARAFDRLGRWIHRRRLAVLAASLLAGGLGAYGALGVQDVLYGSTVEIPGTPSHEVTEALRKNFDQPFAELAVVTTESAAHTVDDPVYQQALGDLEEALKAAPGVRKVSGYLDHRDARLRSADGHVSAIMVGLTATSAQDGERETPKLRAAVATVKLPGFKVATTGRGALAYDLGQYGARDSQAAEGRVIPWTMLILLLAFGAPLAAGIPLAMGLLTTATTLGLIAAIAHHLPLGNMVQNISTMVGLAIGIDYALIMVGRFREALARGLDTEDAVAECMRTAGVSVACSGLTVMIGLAGLGTTPSLDTRSIGLGGALVLVVGVTLALTLLPALLSLLGHHIDSPRWLTRRLRPVDAAGLWRRWSATVMRHAWLLAGGGLVVLALLCSPLRGLSLEFAGSHWIPTGELEFHQGFDMLEKLGRKNASTPIDLLITAEHGAVLDQLDGLLAYEHRLRSDGRIAELLGPLDVKPGFSDEQYRRLYRHWKSLRAFAPGAFNQYVSRDGSQVLVQAIAGNEVSYEEVKQLARELAAAPPPPGLRVAVGGQAAFANDLYVALLGSLPGVVTLVVGATFLLLALAYRSILIPLKATLLNLLSVGAGFGALVMLFQWGWGQALLGLPMATGGIPLSVLVLVFCVVFGLSMDYEVFLISRIHEGFRATGDNARATEEGLAATGGVITSAALIMVTVFGGFALAKLVVVQMLGVGLGVAVLVDATVVRVLVAPALMKLAGRWNWWPGAARKPGG